MVQPFRLGDRISVSYSTPAAANSANRSAWFEGTCEKVDLRCAQNPSLALHTSGSTVVTMKHIVDYQPPFHTFTRGLRLWLGDLIDSACTGSPHVIY